MSGQFDAKYTEEQRRAIEYAYLDAAIRPATEIPRLAAAGQLVWQGHPVEAFEIPYATALEIGKAEERRRTGRAHSQLVNQPHNDAVETLRRRMVSLLDHETNRLEREQRKAQNKPIDAEQLRKVGRALRELASMPKPGTRGVRPGSGARAGEPTGEAPAKDNSMAGALRAALRGGAHGAIARGDAPENTSLNGATSSSKHEGAGASGSEPGAAGAEATQEAHNGGDGARPGAYARTELAGLSALAVDQPAS
jgi:hypothetical protein